MPTVTASEVLAPWFVLNWPPQNLAKYMIILIIKLKIQLINVLIIHGQSFPNEVPVMS